MHPIWNTASVLLARGPGAACGEDVAFVGVVQDLEPRLPGFAPPAN